MKTQKLSAVLNVTIGRADAGAPGRADPKLSSPVRHRGEATQRALVRLKVREVLVPSRVNLVNSVRFLLKSLGVFVPSSIKARGFAHTVCEQVVPADVALSRRCSPRSTR